MKIFRTFDAQRQRTLVSLFAAGLFFWASLTSLLSTFPLYVEDVGGTPGEVGLTMGAFAIGLLLSRPWLSNLADRHSRKQVLLIGLVAVTLPPIGYLFVQSIPILILIRIAHGISISAFALAYAAIVADVAPATHRGEVLSYMLLVQPIAMSAGPALGSFIQAAAGYIPLFLLAAILGLGGLLCGTAIPDFPAADPPDGADRRFWSLLNSPRLLAPTLVLLLVGLAFGTLTTFMPLQLRETGVSLNAGFFYTASAIASFSVRLFSGRASDRWGRGLFITSSVACETVSMVLLWLANDAETFLLAGIVHGLGFGMLIPSIGALLADRSQPHERGRLFGLCLGGFDLGIAIAGLALAQVAETLGYRHIFGVAAGMLALSVVIFATRSSKDLRHSLRFAVGLGGDAYALKQSNG